MRSQRWRAASVAGIVVVSWAGSGLPARAAGAATPNPKKFCAAVQTFNATRPSTKDESVAALTKLASASPPPVKAAMGLIAQDADAVDPASVLAQASGAQTESTPLTLAGTAVADAVSQTCHTSLNFAAAVPSGISRRQVDPVAWARTVCASFSAWGHTVNDAGANLVTSANGQTTLLDLRNTLSQFLIQAATATEQLGTQLGAAGIPKTARGSPFSASLRLGVSVALLVFVGSQPTVQALPNDAHDFQVQAQALVGKLDAAGRSVEALARVAAAQLKVPAMTAVFAHLPGCAGIR